MGGTRDGGLRAAQSNTEFEPNFYQRIGAIGGKKGHTGGFYANRALASAAGRLGGLRSRRGMPPRKLNQKLYFKVLANLERVQEESRRRRYETDV